MADGLHTKFVLQYKTEVGMKLSLLLISGLGHVNKTPKRQ